MRGLGIGILITTIVLSLGGKKVKLSDKEIMARAGKLGMVMKEADSDDNLEEVLEHSLDKEDSEIDVVENNKDNEESPGIDGDTNVDDVNTDTGADTDVDDKVDENNIGVSENPGDDGDFSVDITEQDRVDTEQDRVDTGQDVQELDEGDTGQDVTELDIQDPSNNNEDISIDVSEPSEGDMNTDAPESFQITFTIARGMSSRQVSELLVEKGLIGDAVDFDDYIKRQGKASVIRIGIYTLPKDSDYLEILNAIAG